jgi:outer membrane protein assembly factor BamB
MAWRTVRRAGSASRLVPAALLGLLSALLLASGAQADWTTFHGDPGHSGVDSSAGTPQPFAPAWSVTLTSSMEAQPLIYGGLVIVATENNDIYAYNAASGQPAWHVNAGTPVTASSLPCGSIAPTVGITSTPVIDPANGNVYAVADIWDGTSPHHTLFAYNAATGAPLFSRNVDPSGSTPKNQLQRPALNISGGHVLIGFGGNNGDCAQYWGWLVSAPEDNNGTLGVWKAPSTKGDAIWATGGISVDAAGSAYLATGNGYVTSGTTNDGGENVIRFDASANKLDYFAPTSWASDNNGDADLGSVAPQLLSGGLIYQGGKNGNGYLLDSSNLGGVSDGLYHASVCQSFGADAFDAGLIYVSCTNGIRALSLDSVNRRFAAKWTGPSDANGPPIVAGGLVWVTAFNNAKLYGLDPQTGAVRVTQTTPGMVHFNGPSAANGRLFLAAGKTLEAYTIGSGPPPGSPTPPPPAPLPTPVTNPTPPQTCGCPAGTTSCHSRLLLRLAAGRRVRVVRAVVLIDGRRVTTRRGRHLTSFLVSAPQRLVSFTIEVRETTKLGHHLTLHQRYRDCRLIKTRVTSG